MARKLMSIERCLDLLAATPVRFSELTKDLTSDQLRVRPSREQWSANEVLAHVRACVDARGECIPRIIAEEQPTIRTVNPLRLIKHTNYLELDFRRSFRAFARQRAELLALLKALPPDSWERKATITGAGAVRQRSVLFYADWLADHERSHFKQIAQIAAAGRTRSARRGDPRPGTPSPEGSGC